MPHPVQSEALDDPRVITATRSGADPLFAADYVITDYSTVMYEAGLMGMPVYLYAYDWDTYHEKRSFNIDLARDVPTLFTNDAAAIATAIEVGQFDDQAFTRFTESNIRDPRRRKRNAAPDTAHHRPGRRATAAITELLRGAPS